MCRLASDQNTTPLSSERGEQFSFVHDSPIVSSGKKPLVPCRLLDKKRPGHGSHELPGCAHNLYSIIKAGLQLLNRLETSRSQSLESANRANFCLDHLTYNPQCQFLALGCTIFRRYGFPYSHNQAAW